MQARLKYLPALISTVIVFAMSGYGPIAQFAHYHDFADQSVLGPIAHARDVLSNLGFALVALFGVTVLALARKNRIKIQGLPGYSLFLASLFLTALGSSYYHLAPDDARLLWDRLPIALACAGILAAIRAETVGAAARWRDLALFSALGIFSVLWWQQTGDLRPYLLLQLLTLILIPLWQMIYQSARRDRIAFGLAVVLYAAARVAELQDMAILQNLGVISGHSLKHLLATFAAAVIVARLLQRARG